jgi:hypothetical protein
MWQRGPGQNSETFFFFGTATITFIVSLHDHTFMRIPAATPLSLLCIALLLAAGCAQTSFGTRTPVGFGTGTEDQQIIDCLKAKYGEACSNGPPRFVEPIIATRLNERNLPVDAVVKLNKNTKNLYFWVFFDRFQPKDPVTLSMKYLPTSKVVDSVEKTPNGNCGAIRAEYLMPDGGWPLGQYEITISGRGVAATKTFEVISGETVTTVLPYSREMCSGTSPGTVPVTTISGTGGTASPFVTLQTTGSGMTGIGIAPAGWTGCWHLDSSPCGPTELQLLESGSTAAGFWCQNNQALSITRHDTVVGGSWRTVREGEKACCDNGGWGPYRYYCDPVCMAGQTADWTNAFPDLFTGSYEFRYGSDGRSLTGKWGYANENLATGGTAMSGSTVPCTMELTAGPAPLHGISPTITQTIVVVQPDR